MKEVEITEAIAGWDRELEHGVFLTTGTDTTENTMTIAWGATGRFWNRPCIIVAVRHTRHTHELLDHSDQFVISIPAAGSLKQELSICGTRSGREIDKFDVCSLTKEYVPETTLPLIAQCEYHLVCTISYRQSMDPLLIDAEYVHQSYKDHDHHSMYYAQIIKAYRS
jgi:flavin reductase (DIM6/NTAB) family NADH-FMN oxidoreductase RutF